MPLLKRFNCDPGERSSTMRNCRMRASLLILTATAAFAPQLFAQDTNGHRDEPHARKKIVGYFPQWGIYSNYFVKNVITSGSARLLTQLNYAFADVQHNRCVSFDPWADYQSPFAADQTVDGQADSADPNAVLGNFHQLKELKKLHPQLRMVMAIGGASADPNAFSSAALPAHRKAFVKSCVDMYVRGNFAPGLHQPGIFDGFDIDWEFPASNADKLNFTALLAEFRDQLDDVRPGLSLSIAAPAGSFAYDFIELDKIQRYLNYLGVMTYDYDGPWNFTTGFVAPLYRSLKDGDPTNNIEYTLRAYLEAGVEPEKIVFGVPFYGYEWTNVPNLDSGLFEPGNPLGFGAGYKDILPLESQFKKYRDSITRSPWLYDGNNFWTYDDPVSIEFKMDYVRNHHFAGVMMWELSSDLSDGRLIKTVVNSLKSEDQQDDHSER
jgi:chitinase